MTIDKFERVAFLHKRMQALDAFSAAMEDHDRAMRFGITIESDIYAMLFEDFQKFITENKREILEEVKKL